MNKTDLEKEKELADYKHKLKMEELQFIRDSYKIRHQWELELQRIRSAEIRKTQERRTYAR